MLLAAAKRALAASWAADTDGATGLAENGVATDWAIITEAL